MTAREVRRLFFLNNRTCVSNMISLRSARHQLRNLPVSPFAAWRADAPLYFPREDAKYLRAVGAIVRFDAILSAEVN